MDNFKLDPLKEPRGFIRVLQFVCFVVTDWVVSSFLLMVLFTRRSLPYARSPPPPTLEAVSALLSTVPTARRTRGLLSLMATPLSNYHYFVWVLLQTLLINYLQAGSCKGAGGSLWQVISLQLFWRLFLWCRVLCGCWCSGNALFSGICSFLLLFWLTLSNQQIIPFGGNYWNF